MSDLLGHPVWRRVPAVRNDRVLVIDKYRHWVDAGILGRGCAVDDVVRAVAPESFGRVNARAMVWVNRLSGAIIIAFGLIALARLVVS